MNTLLLILILVVLVVIAIVLVERKPAQVVQNDNSKPLEEMASLMRNAHEEAERAVRDKELADYASRKRKIGPTPVLSNDQSDRQVHSGRDLIPYGLTEEEKRILEEFNR